MRSQKTHPPYIYIYTRVDPNYVRSFCLNSNVDYIYSMFILFINIIIYYKNISSQTIIKSF